MTLTELSEKIGRPITVGRAVSSSVEPDYQLDCRDCGTRMGVPVSIVNACLAGAALNNIHVYCLACEPMHCTHDWEVTGSYTRRGKIVPIEWECTKCRSLKDA